MAEHDEGVVVSETRPVLQQVTKPAHPMPGYVVLVPIPASEEKRGTMTVGTGMLAWTIEEPGVISGVLLESGPCPPTIPEMYMPYPVGATLLYAEHHAIKLGGLHYVALQHVLAWTEAPE